MSQRNARGQYLDGTSGNPGGRSNFKKVLASIGMTTEALRIECVRFARETMLNSKARTIDRLRAMEWLGALAGLKPQLVAIGESETPDRPITELSDAELDAIIAEGEEIEGLIAAGKVLDVAPDGSLVELDDDPDGPDDEPDQN